MQENENAVLMNSVHVPSDEIERRTLRARYRTLAKNATEQKDAMVRVDGIALRQCLDAADAEFSKVKKPENKYSTRSYYANCPRTVWNSRRNLGRVQRPPCPRKISPRDSSSSACEASTRSTHPSITQRRSTGKNSRRRQPLGSSCDLRSHSAA